MAAVALGILDKAEPQNPNLSSPSNPRTSFWDNFLGIFGKS